VQKYLVKNVQAHYFKEVLEIMKNPKKVEYSENHKAWNLIKSLGLQLDQGILWVTGRIFHPGCELYGKIPLMPGKGPIAWCMMKEFHFSTGHGGANHMLAASREKFWFQRGAKLAVSIRKRCEKCALIDRPPVSMAEATLPSG